MDPPAQSIDPHPEACVQDPSTLEDLLPLVYDELRRIARRHLYGEQAGHTLCTTALVHEAYLRLAGCRGARWIDRTQFLAVASTTMRRVLVDHARRHRTAKRGGGRADLPLEWAEPRAEQRADALLALDEALTRLAALDERLGKVIECRFFGGLTEAETAAALGVTERTVRRDWVKARGWILRELEGETA